MSQGNSGGPPKGKGGTVMISQSPFAQPGAPQPPPDAGGYGAPPAPGGYGAPPAPGGFGGPPAPGGFGAPAPGGFGGPPGPQPGGFGGPPGPQPGGFGGAPDAGGYGAPPAGGFGAPQGGFGAPQAGFGGPNMAPAPMGGGAMVGPGEIRNPTTITLISLFGCGVGAYYGLHQCRMIEGELKRLLGRPDTEGNILWYIFGLIPILSMPALVAEARARVGAPTQGEPGLLGYLFGWFYMIPKDANEIYEAAARRG